MIRYTKNEQIMVYELLYILEYLSIFVSHLEEFSRKNDSRKAIYKHEKDLMEICNRIRKVKNA